MKKLILLLLLAVSLIAGFFYAQASGPPMFASSSLGTIGAVTTVGASGADYTDLSDAVTAATANDTILVFPGTYTDTITFAANGVTIIGMGKAQNVILTQAAANVVDFNTRTGSQIRNMTIKVTAATTDIDTIIGSTGVLSVRDCNIQMVATAACDIVAQGQPAIVHVSGAGTFKQRGGSFTYTHPGDSVATGIKAAFKGADNSTIGLYNVTNGTVTTSDGALVVTVAFDLGVTTTIEIDHCNIDITDSTAGSDEAVSVVGLGYLSGDATTHEYFMNVIHVTAGASSTAAYGIFGADAGTSTTHSHGNHLHVTGAASNYGFFVGAGNTFTSHFDDIVAASDNNVTGTLNMVSSLTDGELTITGTTFGTTFDTNVAAAGVTLSGTSLVADGTDSVINIAITPKGTGEVDITKVDIDSGTVTAALQCSADLDLNTHSILFSAAQAKTVTLTGFHSGNQTQSGNITSTDGNNMLVRQVRAYISTDPTADQNINFRLSLYNADSMTEDELIKDFYFNLTYTETNGGASGGETSDTIDDGSGLVKYDLIRYIGGTAENVRLTGTPTATTIAFTALANAHSDDTGIVRVEEITNSFFLVDADASNEIHVKLQSLSAATASMSVVIEVDLQ